MMLCHYGVMQTNKLNSAHWHYEDTFSVNFFFAHAETQSILLSLFLSSRQTVCSQYKRYSLECCVVNSTFQSAGSAFAMS